MLDRLLIHRLGHRQLIKLGRNAFVLWSLIFLWLMLYLHYAKNNIQHCSQCSGDTSFFNGTDRNPGNVRIDWHDYAFMKYEEQRQGIGEQGLKASTGESNERQKALYKANGYDGFLSDLISVNRSVRDVRPEGCRARKYLKHLPTVSAIIPVYNEHFSIVMRTAHSIMNRDQGDLVKEVIFVDDLSDAQFINASFDAYVAQNFKGRGKVVHLKERVGLIQARMAGARIATSDVLLFSDAHTEATTNYLPPLLDPIAENYRVCTVPIEDFLDVHNFEYPTPGENTRAIFDWHMNYYTIPLLPEDAKDPSKPYKNAVMKGGLFAISAKFFWEVGGYDDQLEIWGGEQYEISFKIWLCGGELYIVPCSHFGHMFRRDGRPFVNPRPYDAITRNYKRVIEVWMDEYKHVIFNRDSMWNIDAGPMLKQRFDREKCKPFKWFLENVAPEITEQYPPEGVPWYAKGAIRSVGANTLCVDVTKSELVGTCGGDRTHPANSQNLQHSFYHDINQYGFLRIDCLSAGFPGEGLKMRVTKAPCYRQQGDQFWRYDRSTKLMLHNQAGTHCMEVNPESLSLHVSSCNQTNPLQQWEWSFVNDTMVDNWIKYGAPLL